jgi:thymidylate kinase
MAFKMKQSQFVKEFFQRLNQSDVVYCVLKNFTQLPEQSGRDVDLWIEERDINKCRQIMFEVAQDLGWDLLATSLRLRFINAGEYYFINNESTNQVWVLDLSAYLHWKGISYLDHRVLSKHIQTHPRGFKIASPGLEAASLIFRGAMAGVIKDRDKPRITECLKSDPHSFLDVLQEPFSHQVAELILAAARDGNWDFLEHNMKIFQKTIFKRALLRHPFFQIKQWLRYYTAIWRNRLSPTHGFFITLLGPDGAGKTTIAKLLVESDALKNIFPRQKYFYRRFEVPWKNLIHQIKRTGVRLDAEVRDDRSVVPMEPLKALIYAVYLACEYFTGHLFLRWWKSNAGLVVFDRYFYDYLVFEDFARCPWWLLFILAKIVPRPDALIYLQNDAATIYARKPERSIPEINRQIKICERLVARLPNSFTINSSKAPEKMVGDIKNIIIRNLRERNRHFAEHKIKRLHPTRLEMDKL